MAKKQIKWGSRMMDEDEVKAWEAKGFTNPTPVLEEAPPPAPNVINLAAVPARQLKSDIMQVYNELGGAEYLKQVAKADPDLFHRLLMKIIPQAIEADVKMEATIREDIKALTTDQLKLMVMERLARENSAVIDVESDRPERPDV